MLKPSTLARSAVSGRHAQVIASRRMVPTSPGGSAAAQLQVDSACGLMARCNSHSEATSSAVAPPSTTSAASLPPQLVEPTSGFCVANFYHLHDIPNAQEVRGNAPATNAPSERGTTTPLSCLPTAPFMSAPPPRCTSASLSPTWPTAVLHSTAPAARPPQQPPPPPRHAKVLPSRDLLTDLLTSFAEPPDQLCTHTHTQPLNTHTHTLTHTHTHTHTHAHTVPPGATRASQSVSQPSGD
jgi:hypothetical protein